MRLKEILLAGGVLFSTVSTGCSKKEISGDYKGYSTTREGTLIKIGKEFYPTTVKGLDTLKIGKNYSFTLTETPIGDYISNITP